MEKQGVDLRTGNSQITLKTSMELRNEFARKILLMVLRRIKYGCLKLTDLNNNYDLFGSEENSLKAEVRILDPSFYWDALTKGDVGMGWAWVAKKWESPDLYKVWVLLVMNERELRKPIRLFEFLNPAIRHLKKIRREHSLNYCHEVARKHIGISYNIGNDFFESMLDPTMNYTCAIWPSANASLEEAQINKMKIVTTKAMIEKHHKVLEIGFGWGALSEYIYNETGAEVTAVNISEEQYKWVKANRKGVDYQLRDYRDIEGIYDRIVSVGMVEHAGVANLNTYFKTVADHLKPGGRFVMHSFMHMEDVLIRPNQKKPITFLNVTFPNADLPTYSQFFNGALSSRSLRLLHSETFGIHYARTMREWAFNLMRNKKKVIDAYSEELYRVYIYTWMMAGALMETKTSLVQMVFEKCQYGDDLSESVVDHIR